MRQISLTRSLIVFGHSNVCKLGDIEEDVFDEIEINAYEDQPEEEVLSYDIDDTPVVRFVNKILLEAIQSKTSDIHFEPYEKMYRVRYRQDGILPRSGEPTDKISQHHCCSY